MSKLFKDLIQGLLISAVILITLGGVYILWPSHLVSQSESTIVSIPMAQFTNETNVRIQINTSTVESVQEINGKGNCPPVVISNQNDIMLIQDGVVHVNGKDELMMNAGYFAACYLRRFVYDWRDVSETTMYDAVTVGMAQACLLNHKSYSEFVKLMGGNTFLPKQSYANQFRPEGLPLHFVEP